MTFERQLAEEFLRDKGEELSSLDDAGKILRSWCEFPLLPKEIRTVLHCVEELLSTKDDRTK